MGGRRGSTTNNPDLLNYSACHLTRPRHKSLANVQFSPDWISGPGACLAHLCPDKALAGLWQCY